MESLQNTIGLLVQRINEFEKGVALEMPGQSEIIIKGLYDKYLENDIQKTVTIVTNLLEKLHDLKRKNVILNANSSIGYTPEDIDQIGNYHADTSLERVDVISGYTSDEVHFRDNEEKEIKRKEIGIILDRELNYYIYELPSFISYLNEISNPIGFDDDKSKYNTLHVEELAVFFNLLIQKEMIKENQTLIGNNIASLFGYKSGERLRQRLISTRGFQNVSRKTWDKLEDFFDTMTKMVGDYRKLYPEKKIKNYE